MMKKFNQQMENLENDPLQKKLKMRLMENFFNKKNTYKHRIKIAVGFSILFLVLTITFLLQPDIPTKLNAITFGTKSTEKKPDVLKEKVVSPLPYTSINNPKFKRNVMPQLYEEDGAYLIRQYSSNNDDGVVIVSKFDNGEKINTNQIY